ncbi:MAG: serine hydrolase [Sphingomicrobium sp.]
MVVLSWILAFFAQPASAASSPELMVVERQLSDLVSTRSGDFGIAAVDLTNGSSVSINGDRLFPMASTVKLAVAGTFLSQVDHGRRTLSDRIAGRSAAQLIELMLTHSDNAATDALINNLGGPGTVQTWLNFNGLYGIRIDRTISQLLRSRRDLQDRRDSSSPMSMISLLRQIDHGPSLSSTSRSFLLGMMARCVTGRNRMKALLPAGTLVQHKTGTLDGLTGDVGFITMPDGRRIAVAFFARGGSNRPSTIAQAARAIYDGFSGSWGGRLLTSYGATVGSAN